MTVSPVVGSMLDASAIQWGSMPAGLAAGAIGVLVSSVAALALRTKRPGVAGLAMAAAIIAALRFELGATAVPFAVVAAVLVAFAGGEAVARVPRLGRWAHLLVVPGGLVLVLATVPGLSFGTRAAVGVCAAGSAMALADFDARHRRDGLAFPLLAVAAAGVMFFGKASAAGPVLVGAVVLFAVLVVPKPQAGLGAGGAAAAMVAHWWAVALVVSDRGPRIAAAFVALGFLLFEPLARAVVPSKLRPRPTAGRDRDSKALVAASAIVSQALVVVYAVVFTERQDALDLALFSALVAVLVGTAVATLVVPLPRRRHRRTDDDDERREYPGWGRATR